MVNKNYCFLNFIYDNIKKYDKIIYVDILYIGSGSMDQKRIGNLIKELRKKNNLTQEKFAEKYGVTYQAVSKWENGKNIPDISLLKQICDDYDININDLLDGKNSENNQSKKVNKKKIIYISLGVLLLILIIVLFIVFHDDSFTFKTVSSNCSNFEISGSIAYNKNKSYLYISNTKAASFALILPSLLISTTFIFSSVAFPFLYKSSTTAASFAFTFPSLFTSPIRDIPATNE